MSHQDTAAYIEVCIRELRPLVKDLQQSKAIRIVEEYCTKHNLNIILIKRILGLKWKILKPVRETKEQKSTGVVFCEEMQGGPYISELFSCNNEFVVFLKKLQTKEDLHKEYKQLTTRQEKYNWIQANKERVRAKKEKTNKLPRVIIKKELLNKDIPAKVKERIRQIPGYSNYYISEYGIVFKKKNGKEIPLASRMNKGTGYLTILLYKNNKRKAFRVHRLVAKYFVDNPKNLTDIFFYNNDKADCRASNLYFAQQPGNIPTWNESTPTKGETCVWCTKLTENRVIGIFMSPLLHNEIAKQYGISRNYVGMIKNGKRWKWLTKKLTPHNLAM